MTFFVILILSAFAGSVISSAIYGDIGKVSTTGASCGTAQQDHLPSCGVTASAMMAKTDLQRVNKYKSKILSVARKKQMDASVIAGIMSRETRAGNVLENGWGDKGNGFGLMQVDKRYHKLQGTWDSEEHISQAIDILISMYKEIQKKFNNSSKEKILKGAIAAYNAGASSVSNLDDVDRRTTGKDYANDVVARAQFYSSHGY